MEILNRILLALAGNSPVKEGGKIEVPGATHPPLHYFKTIKLGVIVGHTKDAPGADLEGTNYGEYKYNSEVAALVKSLADNRVNVEVIFRDGIGLVGAYAKAFALKCDCVVELHFNAYNEMARGSLTLCSPEKGDVNFATILHSKVVNLFGKGPNRPDRGINILSRSDRGGMSVSAYPGMANCLLEPAFGDQETDAQLLLTLKAQYAQAILAGVVQWATLVGLLDVD